MRSLNRLRGLLLAAAMLLSAGCHALARQGEAPGATVSAADQMRADISYLASDLLDGRGTGTAGNDTAALFIARRYNALRLSSIAQADRAACAKGGRLGKADCFVLPFTATVPVRNAGTPFAEDAERGRHRAGQRGACRRVRHRRRALRPPGTRLGGRARSGEGARDPQRRR
ncbi:MAG: hypothetical protein AAB224_02295 [Gemmatimonadota bacterium]